MKRVKNDPQQINQYWLKVGDIRRVADGIRRCADHGLDVLMNIRFRDYPAPGVYDAPLPSKPLQLRKLEPHKDTPPH